MRNAVNRRHIAMPAGAALVRRAAGQGGLLAKVTERYQTARLHCYNPTVTDAMTLG